MLEGVYYGHNPTHYEEIFRRYLHASPVLGISEPIAERYARLSGLLRARGMLISAPDLFIAVTALEHGLVLLTRNFQHFYRIPDLQLYPK